MFAEGTTMKMRLCRGLFVAGALVAGSGIAAADDGWMRPGVRVWYLGAVDGGGVTSSNANEAYLFDAIDGTSAQVVHHSALTHWTSPKPVENGAYPLLDMGPCWIHPLRLQTLQMGEHWMGQEITFIERPTYTYETFPYRLLPIGALFALSPQRQIVKLTYMMPGFSVGNAYFDADTGILLYRHALWGTTKMFFILAEINYDFAGHAAFPEDDGPHAGFRSFVSEQSLGSTWGVGGGSVVIHAFVEARYGKTVEMRVTSAISSAYGSKQADENFCFFGDVPIVRAIDATQAANDPPEQWTPFGEYLWWWLPVTARQNQTINVIGVPLERTTDEPLAFTATTVPAGFHFNALWFDARGYLTAFGAKDPTIGLDVQPGDMYFQNGTTVDGLSYYLSTMAKPFPVHPRGDFTGDLKTDVLWRHATGGDVWLWPMDGAQRSAELYVKTVAEAGWAIRGLGDQTGDGQADLLWRHAPTGMLYLWTMNGSAVEAETYVGTVEPAYDIVGTGDYNGDGKTDILWRHLTNGQVWLWLMDGPATLSVSYVDTVAPAYVVQGSGDLNGDGKADLVWRHAAGGDVWVWLMTGATATSVAYVSTVGELDYRIVGVADYTGDGKADLLWHHATRGEVWLWPMDGTTQVSQAYVDTVPDTGYRIVGTGDYDGDGQADILWHHATRGDVWVWLMNGPIKLSQTYVATVPEVGYQIVR
jgi:hypothetical protein